MLYQILSLFLIQKLFIRPHSYHQQLNFDQGT